MKLKCVDHNQRVVVLQNNTTVHRNNSGDVCNSFQIYLGAWYTSGSQGRRKLIQVRFNRREGLGC